MTLRVATFNIRNLAAPDWNSLWWRRRRALGRVMDQIDADLWGLQEVYPLQQQWLMHHVVPDYRWVGSGRTARRSGEGLYALARRTRLQVEESDVRWFGSTPTVPGSKLEGAGFPRIVVLARVVWVDRRFLVANLHLDEKSPERRAASVRQLARWLEDDADGDPVVVMGDFNQRTWSDGNQPLRDLGLTPVLDRGDGGTSHGFRRYEAKQIDNIWLSPHWTVTEARVATESGKASDHDPVVADIDLD